jgi:hypothetical protein
VRSDGGGGARCGGGGGGAQPKTFIDPVLNVAMPYCPYGRYVHIPPAEPSADWSTDFGVAWWADAARYCVGHLSRAKRTIRVLNTLTGQDQRLEVCAEETLNEIKHRYLKYNAHANRYCALPCPALLPQCMPCGGGLSCDDVVVRCVSVTRGSGWGDH